MEPNSPKKIQFAVPLFQSHLDPQAAEHIRKRRPTPATLVIYNDPNASELQLVVEQHFQRHEQMEAGLSDSPDTPSPIAAQQPNGPAAAQWAINSSTESYVSCDEQAGSSEMGGESSETPVRRQKSASSPSSVSR